MPKKLTIEDMQSLAKSRDGICLSVEYININTKLLWQCSKGHTWKNTPHHIKTRGQWCPECAGLKKRTIVEMKEFAESRGGKCLSKKYINGKTKLRWQCDNGHIWEAVPNSVINGNSWCSECAGLNKRTIEDMQSIAKSRGGKCLSKKYVNTDTKLRWQCNKGHIWETTPYCVIRLGTWCPECGGNSKLSLREMQEFAKSLEGLCLSDKYINIGTHYKWECSLGHKFTKTFSKIKQGQWCPTCAKAGISEEICRTTFEQIFDTSFPKVRPKWLKNDRGNQMEIDGYSKKLRIGFEYQGEQHFNTNNPYVDSQLKLQQRVDDDKKKKLLCKENDVFLFELTYKTEYQDYPKEIRRQADELGIDVSMYDFNGSIDINRAYIKEDRIEELKNILNKKNIDLLSTKFLGVKHRYKVRCRIDSSEWSVVGSEIIAGAGCKKCSMKALKDRHTGNLNTVIEYAKKYKGRVLSNKYIGASGKYKFECRAGHIFCAKLNNLKHRKQWCPVCENRQIRGKNLGCE